MLEVRDKSVNALSIPELETIMLKEPQADCPVYHHFGPGVYLREVTLPKGAIVIGHRHISPHMNIFMRGDLSMVNADGSVTRMKAPMILTAQPGRKCVYVHEETVWINVYATSETDVETIESNLFEKSDEWKASQIEAIVRISDREDYAEFLREYGLNENSVREIVENESDQIPFMHGSYPVIVSKSPIEGKGLFATGNINSGREVAPARIGTKRTPAGRYANHAKDPNAIMKLVGDTILIIAIKDIIGSKGGNVGDEITVDYRQSLGVLGVKKCQQ
jgi:hypothetical protein